MFVCVDVFKHMKQNPQQQTPFNVSLGVCRYVRCIYIIYRLCHLWLLCLQTTPTTTQLNDLTDVSHANDISDIIQTTFFGELLFLFCVVS